jgi:hypothetical protein
VGRYDEGPGYLIGHRSHVAIRLALHALCVTSRTSIIFHGVMVTSMLVIQDFCPWIAIASAPSSILGERDLVFGVLKAHKHALVTFPRHGSFFLDMTTLVDSLPRHRGRRNQSRPPQLASLSCCMYQH